MSAHLARAAGAIALVLGLCAACTSDAQDPGPDAVAYTAPAGAPVFCNELGTLSALPDAIATLVASPDDPTARAALASATSTASTIGDTLEAGGTHAEVTATARSLAVQLTALAGAPDSPDQIAQVGATLDALGAALQPLCELPT